MRTLRPRPTTLRTTALRSLALRCIGLSIILVALGGVPLAAEIQFTDVSFASGVSGPEFFSSTHHSHGVNWIDFDVDGWPDLFLVGGDPGYGPYLFRNDGDGTFTRVDDLLPTLPGVEMSGSIFADYDRDGDPDLFVYTDNGDWETMALDNPPDGPPNILLRNLWVENGGTTVADQPLFEDVTAAAGLLDLADPSWGDLPAYRSKTAAWLDYDRDGCIDLFVGHLVINAGGTPPNRDRFYRNRCDGTFEDVTAASGINPGTDSTLDRGALAAIGFHLNDDLWPDLYVVNVSSVDTFYHRDLIYENQGPGPDGTVTFQEVSGRMAGVCDDSQAGMGVDVADLDLDGDWDLYISDLRDTTVDATPLGNVLYMNDGAGNFVDNSAPSAGLVGEGSWGVNFFDADHDGWEDLYVSTIFPGTELFFRHDGVDGQGQVRFTNIAEDLGLSTGSSRGSAVADYDRDGDLDFAVVNDLGNLQLYRNDTTDPGHWLGLELRAERSNLDAIGTLVEVTTGAVVRRRQVKGGSSAHSQDSLTVHVGLGGATTVDRVRVRWPSGLETLLEDVAVDQYLDVFETRLFHDGFESGDLSGWFVSR